MKIYVTLTRRRLAAVLAVLIASLAVTGELYSAGAVREDGQTNRLRVEFIQSLGYTLLSEDCTETRDITIPSEFSDVYMNYNDIQLEAGYDLKPYAGCEVKSYKYTIESTGGFDGKAQVNLLVYNGRIIGGDVSSVLLNGNMLPLKRV